MMTKFFNSLTFNTRSILAYFVVLLSFGFLFMLAKIAVPADNRDVLNTAAGLLLGTLSTIVGYYFGSSKSSADAVPPEPTQKTA